MMKTQQLNFSIQESVNSVSPQQGKLYEEIQENNKKIFNCLIPGCGKTFRFKSEIKRHLTIHSAERMHTCTFPNCGKNFKRADALKNHARIHNTTTPFICPVPECLAEFTTKSTLRYHLFKHTAEKIFKCDYPGCDKSFITYAQLKQHSKAFNYHQRIAELNSQKRLSSFADDDDDELEIEEMTVKYQKKEDMSLLQNQEQEKYGGQDSKSDTISNLGDFSSNNNEFASKVVDWDSIYKSTEEKQTEFSSAPSEALPLPKNPENNMQETLMAMVNFMMSENQDLKKKLKQAADLLREKQEAKAQTTEPASIDSFFNTRCDCGPETQNVTEEPCFDTDFMKFFKY
jgi:uncharacterized Zn-finger protein